MTFKFLVFENGALLIGLLRIFGNGKESSECSDQVGKKRFAELLSRAVQSLRAIDQFRKEVL